MNKDTNPFLAIEKIFGTDLSIKKKSITDFPFVYSKNFNIYEITGGMDFIYVVPSFDDIPHELIKDIYKKCQNEFNKKIVIYLSECLLVYKQSYIDSHINFVSSDYDHRLFDNDTLIDNSIFDNDIKKNYTKATQLVVNFYLNNEIKEYSVRDISKQLGISFTSVCRANTFLFTISAVYKKGLDNTAKYVIKSKKDLLDKVKPFLIMPIKKRMLIISDKEKLEQHNGYLSGENAFCKYSLLDNDNSFMEMAFDSNDYISLEEVVNKQSNGDYCYIEEFIYNPALFANDKTVSLLDTYIIASKRYLNSNDERIKQAIKTIERKIVDEK